MGVNSRFCKFVVETDNWDGPPGLLRLHHRKDPMGLNCPEGDGFAEADKQYLLDARAMVQESGGVIGMLDRYVREGVVRAGPRCWITVTRVRLHDSPPADAFGLLPEFCFVVTDDTEQRPELHSFAIDSEIAIDALYNAHPNRARFRVPAPANEIERIIGETTDSEVIRRGAKRFLNVEPVTLEDPPPETVVVGNPPGAGIRFALSDEAHKPAYSFAVNWPLAFVMLRVAWEESNGV
jgi:hypothetical protein